MVDGLAHYAEKVGDTQQYENRAEIRITQSNEETYAVCDWWFGFWCFMAHQPLQVTQRQIHFNVNNQFYIKPFSLA